MKALIVNRDCVVNNIRRVKELAAGVPVYGVLKADGYGMGMFELAKLLAQEGITRFAVTEPMDAARLRDAGHTQEEILLLRSTSLPDEINQCLDYGVVLTIGSQDAALAVNGIAEQRRSVAEAHIEIDVGMGRYGFLPDEFDKILNVYRYMNNVAITGMYTHFPAAFGSKRRVTVQIALFDGVTARLRAEGIDPGLLHAANSSALFFIDNCRYGAVRIGSAFTGRLPKKARNSGLMPATRVQCPIAEIRWLPKGATTGYAGAFKARKPIKTAVLPIGSQDGFCLCKERDVWRIRDTVGYVLSDIKRGLTGRKIKARLAGGKARTLGHVGLTHTVIDISNIQAGVGQIAELDVNPIYAARLPRIYE